MIYSDAKIELENKKRKEREEKYYRRVRAMNGIDYIMEYVQNELENKDNQNGNREEICRAMYGIRDKLEEIHSTLFVLWDMED